MPAIAQLPPQHPHPLRTFTTLPTRRPDRPAPRPYHPHPTSHNTSFTTTTTTTNQPPLFPSRSFYLPSFTTTSTDTNPPSNNITTRPDSPRPLSSAQVKQTRLEQTRIWASVAQEVREDDNDIVDENSSDRVSYMGSDASSGGGGGGGMSGGEGGYVRRNGWRRGRSRMSLARRASLVLGRERGDREGGGWLRRRRSVFRRVGGMEEEGKGVDGKRRVVGKKELEEMDEIFEGVGAKRVEEEEVVVIGDGRL